MKQETYTIITESKSKSKKAFAVLIDPDKLDEAALNQTIQTAVHAHVDYFFVGG